MTNHAIIILPTVFVLVFSDFKSSKMKKLISTKKFTNLDDGIAKTLKEIKKKNKC